MRRTQIISLFLLASLGTACSASREGAMSAPSRDNAQTETRQAAAPQIVGDAESSKTAASGGAQARSVAGQPAPASVPNANQADTTRKLVKNAELTLQTDQPEEGLRRITAAAESRGGYLGSSEAAQYGANGGRSIKITARVPVEQFMPFLAEVRQAGARVLSERITSKDITEEYVDLEARLKVQKETEARYLEFLKQAKNVDDALTVQRELSNVRTIVEQLEGRRRLLESQAALSTVTVNLQAEGSAVTASPSGFWYDVKRAFRDGLDLAVALILFLIRAVIILLPIVLLIFLPLGLVTRWLLRRWSGRAKPPKESSK